MKKIKDLSSISQKVERSMNVALVKEISPIAKKILQDEIDEQVYSKTSHKNPDSKAKWKDIKSAHPGWIATDAHKESVGEYPRRGMLSRSVYSRLIESGRLLITTSEMPSKSFSGEFNKEEYKRGAFLKLLDENNLGIWGATKSGDHMDRHIVESAHNKVNEDARIQSVLRKIEV